jgi:hypothetical protein
MKLDGLGKWYEPVGLEHLENRFGVVDGGHGGEGEGGSVDPANASVTILLRMDHPLSCRHAVGSSAHLNPDFDNPTTCLPHMGKW